MIKNNIFVSLLKQYTNIDVGFINTFFKKFKIGGELNFDITDSDVAKYLGISIINIRKRLANAYSKTKKFIENIDFIKIQSGKTSSVMCMARQMLGDTIKSATLELNASDERGIDVVREKIKSFAH